MSPAHLPFLKAPLELTVLEWCVGWSATVPEFQGWAGNSILTAATSVLETGNHKGPTKVGKHLRWATMIMFQQPKTAALTVWCDQCTVLVNQPILVLP